MWSAINLKPMLLCDQVKIAIYLNRRVRLNKTSTTAADSCMK